MSTSTKLPLRRDPKKVKAVMDYISKLMSQSTDAEIMKYQNLSLLERMQLEYRRNTLRNLIARCSRLKTSVHRNIIFQ